MIFSHKVSSVKFLQSGLIDVTTNLDDLNRVLLWFDEFDHTLIPSLEWFQSKLALAEGFTNAVRHAHRGLLPDTPIEIQLNILSDCLEIRIWDRGSSFNLEAMIRCLPNEVDREAGGGRGLKLMQKMADGLSYTRTADQRNCLLFVKRYVRRDMD